MPAHLVRTFAPTLCGFLALTVAALTSSHHLQAATYGGGFQQDDRQTTPAMQYFGGQYSQVAPRPSLRRQLPPQRTAQIRDSKPFEGLVRQPTLSPYLNLDVRETELSIPNYHAFVRPLQQQQQANITQAANIRKLKQQFRVATGQGNGSNSLGGVPTTGQSSQFLNLGGYFPGLQ